MPLILFMNDFTDVLILSSHCPIIVLNNSTIYDRQNKMGSIIVKSLKICYYEKGIVFNLPVTNLNVSFSTVSED